MFGTLSRALLLLAASLAAGCQPWSVIREAEPDSLAGRTAFVIEPVSYAKGIHDHKLTLSLLSSFWLRDEEGATGSTAYLEADDAQQVWARHRQQLKAGFRAQMRREAWALDIESRQGYYARGRAILLRPHVEQHDDHFGILHRESTATMTVQVISGNPEARLLAVIRIRTHAGAWRPLRDIQEPSRAAGMQLARALGAYLEARCQLERKQGTPPEAEDEEWQEVAGLR